MPGPGALRPASMWGPLLAGAAILVWLIPRTTFPSVFLLLLFAGASTVCGTRVYAFAEGGYQTLIAAALLPAIVIIGPVPAALTGFVGITIYQLAVRKQTVGVAALSVGQRGVSVLVAGAVWSVLGAGSVTLTRPIAPAQGDLLLAGTAGIVLAYAVASALQVSVRYAVRRHVPLWWVLRANTLWDVVSTACVGACGLAMGLPFAGVSYRSELQSVAPVVFASIATLLVMFYRQALAEATKLRDAVADLLRAPNLDELLTQLANHVSRITKSDLLWIVLRRPGVPPRVAAARGAELHVLERVCADPGSPGLGWTLAVRQTEYIDDYRKHPRWTEDADQAFGRGRIRSLVVTPLTVANEVLGTLVVTAPVPHYFTATQQQSMAELSAQAALTMRNAALLTEVSQARDELQAQAQESVLLSEMSDLLQTSLSIEEACAVIGRTAPELFPGFTGAVYLISPSRDLLESVTNWGTNAASTVVPVFGPEDCWAIRRGHPHAFGNTRASVKCKHLANLVPAESLCVPLIAQGDAIGILFLASTGTGQGQPVFSEHDTRLARSTADDIGLAIANLRLREKLQQQSIRDTLTGLYNRRYVEETLARELRRAERMQRSLGVIMFDIDHFKDFNDTFGHDAGDALLRALGTMLREGIRGEDIPCRYGGEEFVLILPEATLEVTRERARALGDAVRHLDVRHRDRALGAITLSVGVAASPQHGRTMEVLLRAADGALYRAKQNGRARIEIAVAA